VDEQLIPQFVQLYYAAQSSIEAGDKAEATKAYQALLASYKTVSTSKLETPHKQLAHQQVKSMYEALAALPSNPIPQQPIRPQPFQPIGPSPLQPPSNPSFIGGLGTKDYMTIGVFVVLILAVLFVQPGFVGLATYEPTDAPQWMGTTTDFTFSSGGTLNLENYFQDDDELVYLATNAPGLDVAVAGSIVAFSGAPGDYQITVMASDLTSITKVPLTIHIT
jgi:hypothetical protein